MSIQKHNYTVILIISLVFFSFPRMLLPDEEKIAVVSKYEGHVEIEHEAVWKSLTMAGNSAKKYSVYNEDTIFTRSSSMADLVFNDNSHLKIKEDTILSISTRRKAESERTQDRVIRNAADTQKDIVRNINLQTGELWANIIPTKSVLTEFETPAGVTSVNSSMLSLIYTGIKTTLEVLDGLAAFSSKGNEILFEMKTGEKVNIFYPGGGRASVEVKAGMVDVWTKFGTVKVETGESVGVSENAITGEITIIAEAGTIEHKTTAGTVMIRESGSLTAKEDSVTGEIMVTDTDDGITITTIDGTTTKVAVGSIIGTIAGSDAPTEYAVLAPGEEESLGNMGSDHDDGSGISLDKGDADTGKVVSNDPVPSFSRSPKENLIENTKNVEPAAFTETSDTTDSNSVFAALGSGNNSIHNQIKDEDDTQENIDHSGNLGNDTASLNKHGSSPPLSTNYLLDFARKIRH